MAKPKPLIVVAEDDPDTRELLTDLLSPHGYRIVPAGTGLELLDLLQNVRPALIILDIQMPGLDGLTAAHEIRACPHTADVPVLVLSALVDGAMRDRLRADGIERVMGKPFGLYDLLRAVQDILEARARFD